MVIIGVTGMISSGKMTLSELISDKYGAPLFDSTAEAKEIINEKGIDNSSIMKNPGKLYHVEDEVYPIVTKRLEKFINRHRNDKYVVLDILLLFELGLEKYCDIVINAYSSFDNRIKRAQKNRDMSIDLFVFLNNKQMSDEDRNKKADYTVDMDSSTVEENLEDIMRKIDAGNNS